MNMAQMARREAYVPLSVRNHEKWLSAVNAQLGFQSDEDIALGLWEDGCTVSEAVEEFRAIAAEA